MDIKELGKILSFVCLYFVVLLAAFHCIHFLLLLFLAKLFCTENLDYPVLEIHGMINLLVRFHFEG